jgi:hypothetical protein
MNKTLSRTLAGLALCLAGAAPAMASSHREAPAIAEDQYTDNTDVYTFISPADPSRLVIVANYVPLLLPSSGPNFYKFSDTARYELKIDNNGDAVEDITYRYTFSSAIKNGQTFLYNLGPIDSLASANLNVTQSYKLDKVIRGQGATTVFSDGQVAPWHVGKRSFPADSYEGVARQAIKTSGSLSTFVGPRDEPFFVDLHVFDLLGVGGAPTTDGVNVMTIVLEVPITDLARGGTRPAAGAATQESVLGIWATASRRKLRVLQATDKQRDEGAYIQVSRLAWPLINEVVIPLQDKDKYNRSQPKDDVTNFGAYILDPEVPKLLNLVLGAGCPDAPSGGRLDIVGLLSPNGTTPADILRINITADQTNAHSGFPNGRTLTDDVTDTLLTVACNNGSPIGDGVNANDKAFSPYMPYLASPHSGNP